MNKLLMLCVLVLGLTGLAGCANQNGFMTIDAKEPLRQGQLSVPVDNGWIRHSRIAYFGRAGVVRYIRLDAPTAAMELEVLWTLALETDLGRRGQPMQPRENGDYVKVHYTRVLAQQGSQVTDSSLETVEFAGRPGFKLTMDYLTYNGLEMRLLVYGAEYKNDVHWLTFDADLVNNYERYLPAFMKSVRAAKFEDRACLFSTVCG